MLTVHPTLLIGPSDWQPERMPKDEFARRIDALWRAFPKASCAVVYGNPAHHAELAYLTNLVPKLEAGVALLSRTGEPKLFLDGGPNMLGAARPLTFVTDLAPLRGGKGIGSLTAESRDGDILLIGAGAMPITFRESLFEAIGNDDAILDATGALWSLMRRKSPHELAAIREACAALNAAVDAIDQSRREGAGVTAAILAGERAANAAGAQDVRTLFSHDGGRTLRPFTELIDTPADSLQVYAAVRRFNYWAEGFAQLSEQPLRVMRKASELLRLMRSTIKAGTAVAAMAEMIASTIRPDRPHPVTARSFASRIGVALDCPDDVNATFEAGEVYSLKVGVTDGSTRHAIVSAVVALSDDDTEVLWTGSQ
jgi:hypothetical protein